MRPNILLFHCHDLGRYLGCYDRKTVQTPNIDGLAAEGVRFSNSFCAAPQCSPSRAAMFTGRYPTTNGVMGLTHSRFAWELHQSERHLAGQLAKAGYYTASIGVMHETQQDARYWGYVERYEKREDAATAREVSDATIDFLRRRAQTANSREAPFFVSAGVYEPHRIAGSAEEDHLGFIGDHIKPDSELGIEVPTYLRDDEGTREELAELQGAIQHVDAQFGRVLETIHELGLREHTLVVFTTDHGVALPRAKCTCYDPGIEVALIARLPSRSGWNGGRQIDALISNLDLMPSLCEIADARVPTGVQGRSWVPLVDGNDYAPNEEVFSELTYHDYYDPMRAIRTNRYKLIVFFSAAPSYMPPTQSWKPRSSPKLPTHPPLSYHPDVELYDLDEDPSEHQNLAEETDYQQIKRRLLNRLFEHLSSIEDPILKGPVPSPSHSSAVQELRGDTTP